METALVDLEKNPDDSKLVNEIFRALHTIKGGGAMFGFQSVTQFTHSVENLFERVRNQELAVDSRIIDIALRSADCIASLLDNGDGGEDRSRILVDIEDIIGVSQPVAPSIAATSSREAEPNDGFPQAWRIGIKPHADILHRGVRIEPLLRELEGMGSCHIVAVMDALPDLGQLDPTSLYLSWMISLSSRRSLAEIRSVFMFVEDYSDLTIEPIDLLNSEGEPVVPRIGEILASRGLLGAEDIETIRREQKPFGEVAVATGKVSVEQVEAALAEQAMVRATIKEREPHRAPSTVRVQKEKLDSLVDLVGELVILQAILESEAKKKAEGIFESISENLAHLTANLRDTIMGIRMVPLEESFASFQRLVRDLARDVGKELKLEISGGSTELDKNIIELLKDPLVHIIRNSADHGIEPPSVRELAGKPRAGTISISAVQVGSHVEIAIADDGAGLNIENIRVRAIEKKLLSPNETDTNRIMSMIFEPGFSTAEKTTDLSGRGVGMDVVKRNIERLRGEVSLRSAAGRGMTVTLSIPLTLVIIEGLLVRIAGHDYIITLSQVEECVDLTDAVQPEGNGAEIINLRGKTIPIVSLRRSLGIAEAYDGDPRIVIVQNDGAMVGFAVDAVIGRKQVVIKPLSSTIRRIKAISGATILGDGSVALILDVAEIIKAKTGQEGRA